AARDPRAAASEALERLDTSRRKLEAEKRALDETTTRRARLSETILYETAGSQVDAYASANRPRIKSLFARLGIAGDPLLAFKDMAGATEGAAGRAGFALRGFFAFKGQRKLLVAAILLFLAGAGLRIAIDQQAAWLGWLRATDSSVPIANWFEAHMDLLSGLREILFLGVVLALGINVWRGLQLLRLVLRGADLLQADLTVRRRETNDLLAFQARRVEALAAEVNSLSRRAAEAERRAGDVHAGNFTLAEPAPFAVDTANEQARTFVAAIGAMVVKPGQTGANKGVGAPRRIVFAIDHLDAVPASRGRDILAHARSLFKQGFVVLAAADPARLAAGAGETAPGLDKWIQVPFQLGELTSRANYATLVGQILGGQAAAEQPGRDAAKSVLDQPMSPAEARLLGGLAPLAGSSARALKRFVNLYRIVRAQDQLHKGALAFLLALDAGGTPAEIAAVSDALARANPEEELDLHHCGARIMEALAAAQSASGKLHVAGARRAAATARLFSFNDRGLS
ncbi:MAG TPA: P-loop NTPase fold protein, partial [Methylocella sp.]|nr:P-loop NTPase fold protein [Methylocella sp.]